MPNTRRLANLIGY